MPENLVEQNKEIILKFMSDEKYVPMKPKEMAFILGVPKDRYAEFNLIIKELESEFKIQLTKKGKCMLVDSNSYKIGVLRLNQRKFGFVKVDDSEDIQHLSF